MFNKSHFFKERLHVSSDLAERIRVRWGIVYHAVDAVHASEVIEHGTDLLQPEAAVQPAIEQVPASRPEFDQAAQIGSNVVGFEAYRAQKYQTAQEVEAMGQRRLASQARLNADAALREGEGYNGQLAA